MLGLWEWRLGFPPKGVPLAAIDLETTGLYPGKDGVTELAVVRVEGEKVYRFSRLVNPKRPIPERVVRLTGIRNEDVRDAPPIEEVLREALPLLEGAVWVIQNAPFDLGFLTPVLRRLGVRITPKVVDTVSLARAALPGLKSYRLGYLSRVLALPPRRHHRALSDAEAALWVFRESYFLLARGREISLEEL